MQQALTRAQFLRGDFSGVAPLRPPWADAEAAFTRACTRCDECIAACPPRILRRGSGGYPEIDFSAGECTACGACRDRCRSGALAAPVPRRLEPIIGANCLSLAGVICRTCAENCEPRALLVRPIRGGRFQTVVVAERCTGCGACAFRCPAQAIQLRSAERRIQA